MTDLRPGVGVFILTHGRPDNVKTWDLLRKYGYAGPVHILIDNEDARGADYRARFGDAVLEFDKAREAELFDTADLSGNRKSVVYARNAVAEMASRLGYTYYVEMDDDYDYLSTRFIVNGQLPYAKLTDIHAAFNITLDFLDASGALCVAWAQGGDLIGGAQSKRYAQSILRKAMNLLFIRTDRPVTFIGRINEDVNTYVTLGNRGELFFTPVHLVLNQLDTQSNAGGMTETYQAEGTYVKSFYPVMMAPSCVTVSGLKGAGRGTNRAMRFHHAVQWENAVPKIISSRYRKES